MRERWGVFEADVGDAVEVHVAPLVDVREGTTRHVLFGLECWCMPYRDPVDTPLVVHNCAS